MLKLSFKGDGEVVGETSLWRHGNRPYTPPRKTGRRRPRAEVKKGPKMCVYCMRVQVYGVSTCMNCLRRIGAEVAAAVLCYPHAAGYRVQVSNLKKVVAEFGKYGVVPPRQWVEIIETRPPKVKATMLQYDARSVVGKTAHCVRSPGTRRRQKSSSD